MRKALVIAAALLALPVFLFVYQPAWRLGGAGLILGALGMTVSPLVILYALWYMVRGEWNK